MARYDAYKSTDSLWFNEVPVHWKNGRVKDFVDINALAKVPTDLNDDDLVEFVPMTNVNEDLGEIKQFNFVPINDVSSGYTKFRNGDVIFAKITPCMENGNCAIVSGLSHNIGFGSTEFMVFRTSSKLTQKYLHYFLYNELFRRNAEPFMKGTAGQKRISSHYMATHYFALPPLDEQKAIAAYLDTKTTQIDRKIDMLTQKVTQYSKLKQSLINETVTRGLDKTVVMKDSGIEWIGEVPEHWRSLRIHDCAVPTKNKNIGLQNKNLLSLSYGKIKKRNFNTSFGLLPASFETYQIVNNGNIILRLTDLQNDKKSLRVGLVTQKGIITSAYLCLKFKNWIDPVFSYYLLHLYDISKVFYWYGGGLRSTMKFDDIKVLPFLVPPLLEQKAIATYLNTKTSHIDSIVETINAQIEKLKDLRKTLINDVVTGKIKVV
ncbi:restriction endonuclease subunit S [Methanolobus mangrovi]|uniref:Restriction endonuclease subunit S n=1 Tax=Methanolobus mangrovi TaxID=3072977 RepID=A0AA51YH91_9EURY|nr:restriction endonuclease subunit S [Methanolobus mangrovi]WMW22921.1 restriction endonuclease subunit S [Methanolobus mangrovi]